MVKKESNRNLGFKAINSIEVKHKIKSKVGTFKIYLMRLPIKRNSEMPMWDIEVLLKGVKFCLAHPLYHPQSINFDQIFEKI